MADENKRAGAPPPALDLSKVLMGEPEDGIFQTYANVVNVNWTLHDIRLRFAELIYVPDEDRPTWENQHGLVLERAAITMPWGQAKYLRDLLDGLIKSYEGVNGELKKVNLAPTPARLP